MWDISVYNYSNPLFFGCTFAGNVATDAGGGVGNNADGNLPVFANCILWQNQDSSGLTEVAQISGGTPVVDFSCVQGWTGSLAGTGTFGDDPLFVDAAGSDLILGTQDDNLHLSLGSPCIDAGDNTRISPDAWDLDGDGDRTEPIPFDLDLHPRFINELTTVNTGNPSPEFPDRIVDMGAFEAPTAGDCTWDAVVDLADYQAYWSSLTGPGTAVSLPCWTIDLDSDRDLDLEDVAGFQRLFGRFGP